MRANAILLRIVVLALALGLTAIVFEFWGTAAGIMGHYLSDRPAPRNDGIISVQVLPPPKTPSKH